MKLRNEGVIYSDWNPLCDVKGFGYGTPRSFTEEENWLPAIQGYREFGIKAMKTCFMRDYEKIKEEFYKRLD